MSVPTALALEVTNATVSYAGGLPDELDISIDSRTLGPGQTYLALRGTAFDGHAFVADAVAAGARALVVSDPAAAPAKIATLVVEDTRRALLALGAANRSLCGACVVAITGSAGKTTTKALLAGLFEHAAPGRVSATPANENNEIGVAKLLLSIPRDAAYAVIELGARHPGDIAPLASAARPDVAIVTNIGEAHLEIFGSPEALATTKWAIFATGARPVLGAGDVVSRQRAASLPSPIVWFAPSEAPTRDLPATDAWVAFRRVDDGYFLVVRPAGATHEIVESATIAIAGAHNLANLAAAAAAAYAAGIEPATIARACAFAALPPGRYERIEIGDIEIVYDAYNASTSGTLATLDSFAHERASRRIAVLGSMAELGSEAPAMHATVGGAAARGGLAALLVGGEFAGDVARGARAAGFPSDRIVHFASNDEATSWLAKNTLAGDLVLLKASRRYRLEEIVAGLRAARERANHDG